jgi:hypothetical protein
MSTNTDPLVGSSPDAGLSTTIGDPEAVASLPTDSPDSSANNTPDSEGEVDENGQPKAGAEDTKGEVREDGRLIPKWMRAMKEADPEGYKAAKSAFFNLKERESVHPTVQAAREEHDLVQSLGGREGASKLQEDSVFFKEAANQFLKGDPAFIKDLFEEDPIAAALHVAPMLEEFKTRDFEGYKSTIARIWANDFKRLNFAPALQDLSAAIQSGDKAAAAAIAQSIQQWHDSILDVSNRAEDPRVKSLLAERNKHVETRQQAEQQEFLKTYRTETINEVVAEGEKVFNSFFRDRKIDAEDRTDLLREAMSIANRAVEADKAFMEQRNKHLEKGDAHSAKRLTKARYAQEMTNAVKRVARRYGLVSGQPKPNTQPTQRTDGQQQPKPAQGFVAVNERPQPEQINRRATSNDMILAGRAILNDGRKVDWSKLKARSA